jgi:hypothetical protein
MMGAIGGRALTAMSAAIATEATAAAPSANVSAKMFFVFI